VEEWVAVIEITDSCDHRRADDVISDGILEQLGAGREKLIRRWLENWCGWKIAPLRLGDARSAIGSYPIPVRRILESRLQECGKRSTSTNVLNLLAFHLV
jgi:hypothetical protein